METFADRHGGQSPLLSQLLGLGMIASWLPGGRTGIFGTLSILVLGWFLEMGRDMYSWVSERWRFQYSLTAEFNESDPAYDWLIAFLMKENVWRHSWNFKISAKTLQKRNGVDPSGVSRGHKSEHAEYVPTYQRPQIFRWKGNWIEITRNIHEPTYDFQTERTVNSSTIYLKVYTRDVSVIADLVEYSREQYMEMSQPHVIVHTSNVRSYHTFSWNECQYKLRRSLDSVILESGVLDSLVDDAREFLDMEEWYQTAGIPHRRGFLLYGPPGTGKTSTIYALAGELGLEIYSLSLASSGIDDSTLSSAVACIPKRSIFLLEDIDCAFSRNEGLSSDGIPAPPFGPSGAGPPKCNVTLSGLLNVLDGVASQEGILFFATTNHIEDLDNALLRPGRIDRKIQYFHSTKVQATALYKRFFAPSHCTPESAKEGIPHEEKVVLIDSLATEFAERVPEKAFTTAELQGFLLTCKFKPEKALKEVKDWVDETVKERNELEAKKKAKQEEAQKKRDALEVAQLQSTLKKMDTVTELQRNKEGGPSVEASKSENTIQDRSSEAVGTQTPGSTQGSDSDSWTITDSAITEPVSTPTSNEN